MSVCINKTSFEYISFQETRMIDVEFLAWEGGVPVLANLYVTMYYIPTLPLQL